MSLPLSFQGITNELIGEYTVKGYCVGLLENMPPEMGGVPVPAMNAAKIPSFGWMAVQLRKEMQIKHDCHKILLVVNATFIRLYTS